MGYHVYYLFLTAQAEENCSVKTRLADTGISVLTAVVFLEDSGVLLRFRSAGATRVNDAICDGRIWSAPDDGGILFFFDMLPFLDRISDGTNKHRNTTC